LWGDSACSKPLYTIEIVSYVMKRLVIFILILLSLFPVQGSNITSRVVTLKERVVVVKFINMGVDAYWGEEILENAASALPLLEDLIGVPLPEQVRSVEIYGQKNLGVEEWIIGYNDGNRVALETDHPNPIVVLHELVHFWTIHCNIPWPLAEGYGALYADLCASLLGFNEVAFSHTEWEEQYEMLQGHPGRFPLNSMNIMSEEISDDQRAYFYLASTVMMYSFYEVVGEENLKAINQQVAQSSLDSTRGGIGIVQYLGIAKDITGINYAELFMPVIFESWEQGQVEAFKKGVGRYCAISELIDIPDSDEQMKNALNNLLSGNFSGFNSTVENLIAEFYAQQAESETKPPEQEIIYPEEETGLLHNRLFIFGIIMLAIVVILLVFILSKLAGEEEEYEWEVPSPEESGLWIPPIEEVGEEPSEEPTEELPEIPDLRELTK
jgi:hypothetical protein